MQTYIVLLRGINVSGRNILPMAALREMLEQLQFANVQTYIQSGNVILQTAETPTTTLAQQISDAILATFGLTVPTVVLTLATLQDIAQNNPFLIENVDIQHLHVTIFGSEPAADAQQKVIAQAPDNEQIKFSNAAAYLYCPDGYHRSKLSNNYLEKQLKTVATTRNWRTISTLLEKSC